MQEKALLKEISDFCRGHNTVGDIPLIPIQGEASRVYAKRRATPLRDPLGVIQD
jgi:hypothetical protein